MFRLSTTGYLLAVTAVTAVSCPATGCSSLEAGLLQAFGLCCMSFVEGPYKQTRRELRVPEARPGIKDRKSAYRLGNLHTWMEISRELRVIYSLDALAVLGQFLNAYGPAASSKTTRNF